MVEAIRDRPQSWRIWPTIDRNLGHHKQFAREPFGFRCHSRWQRDTHRVPLIKFANTVRKSGATSICSGSPPAHYGIDCAQVGAGRNAAGWPGTQAAQCHRGQGIAGRSLKPAARFLDSLMSSRAFTEDQLVEQPAIGLFASLGCQTHRPR